MSQSLTAHLAPPSSLQAKSAPLQLSTNGWIDCSTVLVLS